MRRLYAPPADYARRRAFLDQHRRFPAMTAFKHPNPFGLAMNLAVYGCHFREVAEAL